MVKINGREVGNTGYGLMNFTWRNPPVAEEQAFEAMKAAIAGGAVFWNGGEFYGDIEKGPNSLTLLNKYFTRYPEDAAKVVLSIKGGVRPGFIYDGTPDGIRHSVENCISQLPPSVKKIDVFECARVDPKVPIEDQVRTLAELVAEGKIGGIGLSEVAADTVRRAAKVAPIAAVELELSIWSTDYLENGVMDALAELDIPAVAYSPLGRGFLTGEFTKREDIPEGDFRLMQPRFSAENFPKNLELVDKLKAVAATKSCTPAQLALAWVRGFSGRSGFPQVLPIPGATRTPRVNENNQVVTLSPQENAEINEIMKSITIIGTRYPDFAMGHLEG